MPELPEVETIRRQLDKELKGYAISAVQTDFTKSFRPSFETVNRVIVGGVIKAFDRQAKLLILRLLLPVKESPRQVYLIFHLKLTGQLLVRKPKDPADKYVRSVFTLVAPPGKLRESNRSKIPDLNSSDPRSNGLGSMELRFADARKFGYVKLITDKKEMGDLLKSYGPEPFKDLKLKNFTQILKSSARPIKTILLDQEKISGIGNIYANDALWLAGLDPRRASHKVTKSQAGRLYKAILVVLKRGLKYGGASDQWYVQAHGEKGKYQEHFLVYGKNGEKCQRCGAEIKRIVVGGRGTFYCPACQSL